MSIAGVYPEQGVRVALVLTSVDELCAHYRGDAFTPTARHPLRLAVELAGGAASLQLDAPQPRDDGEHGVRELASLAPLGEPDAAFVRQLGKQLWRLAMQASAEAGGGRWPRRVRRWRGPK